MEVNKKCTLFLYSKLFLIETMFFLDIHFIFLKYACVQGSTNGTNGVPLSFKVLPMVPLVTPLVPMVMPMVPLALPMVPLIPLISQWYHC